MDFAKSKWPRRIVALLLLLSTTCPVAWAARLGIIIDDIGQDRMIGRRAIALPFPAAIAVLPHLPASAELAREAHRSGKEVLLHLPMENLARTKLGPGGLTLAMEHAEVIETLGRAIESVPHAVGVSNHTGSLLTQQPLQMKWVMAELARRDLYFIDSRTTHHTVALTAAQLEGVPALERDVFLDNERTEAYLTRALTRAVERARRRGLALMVAHPYYATIKFLESHVSEIRGVDIVAPSELLPNAGIQELVQRGTPEHVLLQHGWEERRQQRGL
ncbi:MAG: divergent polysaccharide deacetylase family protein [Pseudomonadales bacterium]